MRSTDVLKLAVRAYRLMAYVTGTMLVLLVFVCVPLRYLGHDAGPAEVVGAAHGVLYIIYLVVAFAMTRLVRMRTASYRHDHRAAGGYPAGAHVRGRALGHPHVHRPGPGRGRLGRK